MYDDIEEIDPVNSTGQMSWSAWRRVATTEHFHYFCHYTTALIGSALLQVAVSPPIPPRLKQKYQIPKKPSIVGILRFQALISWGGV